MKIVRSRYVLAVPDADATAAFFIEKLGFQTSWRIEGQWHSVGRDNCGIMLGSCPDAPHPSTLGDNSYFAYLDVDDVDAFHAEVVKNGLDVKPPEDKPWGMREFTVKTIDGHRLTVGQQLLTR